MQEVEDWPFVLSASRLVTVKQVPEKSTGFLPQTNKGCNKGLHYENLSSLFSWIYHIDANELILLLTIYLIIF